MPGGPHLRLPDRPAARHRVRTAPLLALTGCMVAGCVLSACAPGVVQVDPAPEASRSACRRLVAALPDEVADQPRRDVEPTSAGAAWGDPAIVLRCGVGRPTGFDDVATCVTVDKVDWFIPRRQLQREGDLTMTAVNRDVYVEVRLPVEYWPPATALADLSTTVRRIVPATGHCF